MSVKHFCAHQGCPNLVNKGERFCSVHSEAKVFCAHPGCREMVLVTERYCSRHTPKRMLDSRRGNSNERGYSSRWSRVSRLYLKCYPVCQNCGKAPAVLVHHKKPIRDGGDIFDPANLMGLCASCHAKIHAEISAR